MIFWPYHSLLVWIESTWKYFEFGLLLIKVVRDFAHLALQENAPIMLMPRVLYMMFIRYFFKDFFSFTGSLQSCAK
jgi:hypothetical protein